MDDTLRLLSLMIDCSPTDAVHHLLRGEEWLARGNFEVARIDLRQALRLAQLEAETSTWGWISQSYADRAALDLRQCEARQRRAPTH